MAEAYPWQAALWQQLASRKQHAHAYLLHGPAGIGKRALAERLRAAGVNLTYQVYRDLWHAGQIVAAIHPPAAAALAECGRYVQEVLAASPLPEAA